MPVDSAAFFLFVGIVFLLSRVVPRRAGKYLLLAASIVYYATFSVPYVALLLLFVWVNFLAAQGISGMQDSPGRQGLFTAAVVFDLLFLVGFRLATVYFRPPREWSFLSLNSANHTLLYPLGLSFLTVQMIGCLADIYRRTYEMQADGPSFLLFGMFFPQISSGPIPRATDLMPQLTVRNPLIRADYVGASSLILSGLFKKLVIANRLETYVKAVFYADQKTGAAAVLLAIALNALELYADFSGYTDIARGVAQLFGVNLAENFNSPFLAESVTDFWRRWHISFANWLRDNLYMPIAIGLRNLGTSAFVISFLVTFILCGMWHGTSWNFALFGCMHGVALSVEFVTRRSRMALAKSLPAWLVKSAGRVYVFVFFAISQVVFRTATLSEALEILRRAAGPMWSGWTGLFAFQGPLLFLLLLTSLVLWSFADLKKANSVDRMAFMELALALLVVFMGKTSGGNFVYAQF